MGSSGILAQDKCAIKPFQELQKSQGYLEDTESFERWMAAEMERLRDSGNGEQRPQSVSEVITIPVVVHIIHEGEAIGEGTNLSGRQILSQIEVLNEDFRRLNADRVNTPGLFEPVAADIEVEFVLAARDPEGLSTNGIVRVNGGKNKWQLTDNYELKNLSYWPAEDYLNIWVADLNDNFLGYAQFPLSGLEGLETASENEFTDGIIVDYRAFGSIDKVPEADLINEYNKGRTTTHEAGHYLGLRHIWGDGGCNVDDFVDDTPLQGSPNTNIGSPCTFPGPNSCSTGAGDLPDMFQNYMDYTHDECLNLFTNDQKTRMRIVLDGSPRRASLRSSKGAIPPEQTANDLGIREIITPSSFVCPGPFLPRIEVRNYGINAISSFTIAKEINGVLSPDESFTINLPLLETAIIEMSAVELSGDADIRFIITSVNGGADGNPDNDIKQKSLQLSDEINTSFDLNFSTLPDEWIIQNPDGLIDWSLQSANNGSGFNRSLYLNFYDYENFGELDVFLSPVIDLTDASEATLVFDVAYSGFPSSEANFEGLMVTATSECLDPVFAADTLFFKVGSALRTVPSTTSSFSPGGADDWRTEVVSLLPYLGTRVRLAFIGINGYGNNLFLDNLRIDLGSSVRLISPGPAYCEGQSVPLTMEVVNTTTEAWDYFEWEVRLDNAPLATYVFNGNLQPGEIFTLTRDFPDLDRGFHILFARIRNINGSGEGLGESGELLRRFIVSDKVTDIPVREQFENYDPTELNAWLRLDQPATNGWELLATGNGISMALLNQNNNIPGDHDYLISPRFSLSGITEAYMTFELAYKRYNDGFDAFSVLLSTDCGATFDQVIFSRTGSELGNSDFNGQDIPTSPSDWEKITVDLTPYADTEDLMLAFLGINGSAGALFVDNIEFFVNSPVVAENGTLFPNPDINGYFKLTFNRPAKERVMVRMMDLTGRVVLEQELTDVLNQTYTFNVQNLKQGVYIVQVQGETFSFAKRLIHAIY